MRTFKCAGQRVFVAEDVEGKAVGKMGEVTRICTDGSAWIKVDAPSGATVKVKAAPEMCRMSAETHSDRRAAEREAERPQEITPALFGRDHWATLLYIESRCVDNDGVLAHESMRCSLRRHPLLSARHHREPCSSTRLRGDQPISDHDDWDCAEDMVRAHWLLEVGTSASPQYALTLTGWLVAGMLRRFRADKVPLPEYNERLKEAFPDISWEQA